MATKYRCGGRSQVGDTLDFIMKAGTSGGVRFASGRLGNGRSGPQKPSMWVAEVLSELPRPG